MAHSCPTCHTAAKIPTPEAIAGRLAVFLCAGCGEVNLLVDDALQRAPPGTLPGPVYEAIQHQLRRLRELRKAAGFVCPAACPACRSALQQSGLLRRDRVVCPACWTIFVTDDGRTLREPMPDELAAHEQETRELLRQRHGGAAPRA